MSSSFRKSLQLAKKLEGAAKEAKKKADDVKNSRETEVVPNAEVLDEIAGMKHRLKMLALWLGLYLVIITAIMLLYAFEVIQKASVLWWLAWGILTFIFWSVHIAGFPSMWGLRKKKGV